MASSPRTNKTALEDAAAPRLTALERAIDKSEIDVAACIKAFGGLLLKLCFGIALVIAAVKGTQIKLPSSLGGLLNSAVEIVKADETPSPAKAVKAPTVKH